jgi:hypothetical protein
MSEYTPDVVDELTVAWDLFTADIDPVQLERERMRVLGSLNKERPGSRQDHEVRWAHELRRLEFRRQLSLAPVPFAFSERQLQIARDALLTDVVVKATNSVKSADEQIAYDVQQATSGAVSDSAGRVASPTHKNTSTTLDPANGRTVSHTSSTDQWKPETTKRRKAA